MLPKKSPENYPDEIKELIVNKMHEDAFMGLFLPCKKMPQLRVFENLTFGNQLKEILCEKLSRVLFLGENNFLIKLPFFY